MYLSVNASDCSTATDSTFWSLPAVDNPVNPARPPTSESSEVTLLNCPLEELSATGDIMIDATYLLGSTNAKTPTPNVTSTAKQKTSIRPRHSVCTSSLRSEERPVGK